MNFLKRRNKPKKCAISDEEKRASQIYPTERKTSDTSLDDEKISLFYTEQPGKCRMIPIPTPPPSPPKAAIRPRSQPTTTLTNSFHAELPATAAPPSPARSPWSREKVADESVLGRTSRVPSIACSQEEGVLSPLQSPIPATSTKLDSSLTGSEISK